MATVFLSHASLDDARAAQLEAWLRTNGFDDLFVDHSAIRGGDKWADALRRAKASCRVVLCLVTPNWLASDECFGEFTAAWYQGKRIVPLLAGAPADDRQKKRLARVLAEDQGFDLTPAFTGDSIALDAHPAIAEPFKAGLRAGGALMKVGLDPEAFEIDATRRPEPFPGLESFGDEDADAAIFYGRSPEIAELMEILRAMRATGELKPLVVLGASGSGKSSLMKAGLLPRLRRERAWLVLRSFRPGGDALLNFADAIARTAADLGASVAPGAVRDALLSARATGDVAKMRAALDEIVKPLRERADRPDATVLIPLDQGEELSRSQGDSADALGDVLRAAMAPPTVTPTSAEDGVPTAAYAVTVTVRTDTFAELQLSPRFAGLDARCADIRPLPIYRFDNAVEGPAGRYGVEIDPGVVEALMEDAPGADALPLLAFAMQRLWRQYQAQRRIRLENYQSVGKLSGLLEDAAERALRGYAPTEDRPLEAKLPADRERLAQRTFVPALAQVSDQGAPIRRVADFGAFDEREQEMIDQFDRWRLVVKRGQNEVEVAHEALFREWPRFRAWLEPEKARLDMLRSVEAAASAWARHGRQASYLDHRGKRLSDARALLDVGDYASRIGQDQRDYLVAAQRAELRRMGVVGGAAALALLGVLTAAGVYDSNITNQAFEAQSATLNGRNEPEGGARLALAALGGKGDLIKPSGGKSESDRLLAERALHESGYVLPRVAVLKNARSTTLSRNGNLLRFQSVKSVDDQNPQTVLLNARNGRRIHVDPPSRELRRREMGSLMMADDKHDRFIYWRDTSKAVLARASDGQVIANLDGAWTAGFNGEWDTFLTMRPVGPKPPEGQNQNYELFVRQIRDGSMLPGLSALASFGRNDFPANDPSSRILVARTRKSPSELLDGRTMARIETIPGNGSAWFCATGVICSTTETNRAPSPSRGNDVEPYFALAFYDGLNGSPLWSESNLADHSFSNDHMFVKLDPWVAIPPNMTNTQERAWRDTLESTIRETRTGRVVGKVKRNNARLSPDFRLALVTVPQPSRMPDDLTPVDANPAVDLIEVASGRKLATYRNSRSRYFSSDSKRLLLIDGRGDTFLYDAVTGNEIEPLGNGASATFKSWRRSRPVTGLGPKADYGVGFEYFFLRTEDSVTTMRRWANGEIVTSLGKTGDTSAIFFDPNGRRFTVTGEDGVTHLWAFEGPKYLAALGRNRQVRLGEDRALVERVRRQHHLVVLEDVAHLRGAALHDQVCDVNRDWIGPFTDAERDPKKAADAESEKVAQRLRGRPWHVCDWKGLGSAEGWGQMFRYWGVRLGLAQDYPSPHVQPGQPRPAAAKKK